MPSSRFDEAAARWDEQPARVALAQDIAKAILAQVPVRPSMAAIDYGCGTGLLTLALRPAVQRITGVDSSSAMLAKLQEKLQATGVTDEDMKKAWGEDIYKANAFGQEKVEKGITDF